MKVRSVKMAWADIDDLGRRYVNDVLDSGWLSRHKYIPQFESKIATGHGQKYGLMMNSGTDALRIAFATLKEIHKWPNGSEVLVPAVTFVATVNAVIQNSLKPVFVDVDRTTFNMDFKLVAARLKSSTRAICAVHLFGLPADMSACIAIARKKRLKVVEDSCETMFVHKVKGDLAAFSTYMAHMVQTGVGGVLTTNSPEYLRVATSYMNHGRTANPDSFCFERIGYSARATEMEAALGCAQFHRIYQILEKRHSNAVYLIEQLAWLPLQLPTLDQAANHSFMLFPMVLLKGDRNRFMNFMLERGIETRQMMPLINQPPYRHMVKKGEFPVAEWINKNGVCLPVHQKLDEADLRHMVCAVRQFFRPIA